MQKTGKDIRDKTTNSEQAKQTKIPLTLKVILSKLKNRTKSLSVKSSKRLVFQLKVLCFAK